MITLTVLTKKSGGGGHHSTELTIDWTGISQEQLMLLAQARVVWQVQNAYKHSQGAIPKHDTVMAADFVQPDTIYTDGPLNLPKRSDKKVIALAENLTAEEKKMLLDMFGELSS